ncbi:MAG: HAD-IA family hydrolase [Candidatus Nanopelagicales bacterium]
MEERRRRSRALLLDWAGVLTTPVDEAFATWAAAEGVPFTAFRDVMHAFHETPGSVLHEVETGRAPREALEEALADGLARCGTTVSPEGLLARMFADVRPNEPIRSLLREARELGWAIGILSNSWGNEYDLVDLGRLADVVLLSEQIGLRKPEPEAFLALATAVGVDPPGCIFVDDLRRNVRGAVAVGMNGVLYRPGVEGALLELVRAGTTTGGARAHRLRADARRGSE